MAETPEYFDNITIGQFVLTGIPVKVYVNGGYLIITDADDIEDGDVGFGMTTDGEMESFDYRMIDHLLVGDQHIDLDTFIKASEDELPSAENEPEAKEDAKGKDKDKEKGNPFEGKQNMKLKSLVEKALSQQQQKFFGTALSVKRGDTPTSDVNKAIVKVADAMSEKELEKFAGTKHKNLPKKVEEDLSVSDVSEPYTIQVGDLIQNVNPDCMHYGSMGIVQKIMDLPGEIGKIVKYSVTNSGDTYSPGDSLTKTLDQLAPVSNDEWADDMEDWDVVDTDDEDDFYLGKTDPNWNDEDWEDEDELDEATQEEQNAAEEAAKAQEKQGKAMVDAAKDKLKAAKAMPVEK
jgi:hypothetical protein